MGTEVLKSFGTLQFELEQAKISLKGVDENIKRLIGRDPSENPNRPGSKRPTGQATNHAEEPRGRGRTHNNSNFNNNRNKPNFENDEPLPKKRNVESNVFKRLSERTSRHYEDDLSELHGKQLISKIIVTPKEVPSRQDVLAAQSADEKSKARNRRMFGALLGTLQKFRQEETKLKPKEEKRAQVEKKLEEQQIKEREELKKERQDLFFNRKRKQAEIRMIELKMTRMKEHAEWEEKQKPLMNFIQTKSKPHIYFLPKILNETNKKLFDSCSTNIEKMIDRKRQDVFAELTAIENRMKKNFAHRQGQSENEDDKQDDEILEPDEIEDQEEIDVNHIDTTIVKEESCPDDIKLTNNNEKEDIVNEEIPTEDKDNSEDVKQENVEETTTPDTVTTEEPQTNNDNDNHC